MAAEPFQSTYLCASIGGARGFLYWFYRISRKISEDVNLWNFNILKFRNEKLSISKKIENTV